MLHPKQFVFLWCQNALVYEPRQRAPKAELRAGVFGEETVMFWSLNEMQGKGAEVTASSSGVTDGCWHRFLRCCWGLRPFRPERQQQQL
jgi:hypothetical protein